jgi:hypothetical protein
MMNPPMTPDLDAFFRLSTTSIKRLELERPISSLSGSSEVMTVEKFVDATSIDPLYYDTVLSRSRWFGGARCLSDRPRGDRPDASRCLVQGCNRPTRTRYCTSPVRQWPRGAYVARAARPQRRQRFDEPVAVDEAMVQLATQLVGRQTAAYDPADIEDRYETRLRAMLDAKLKGEGITLDEAPEPAATNVVDLMAALRRSLAEDDKRAAKAEPAPPAKSKTAKPAAPKAPANACLELELPKIGLTGLLGHGLLSLSLRRSRLRTAYFSNERYPHLPLR